MWTWGNGKQGRLGHGDEQSHSLPNLVELASDFDFTNATISCSAYYSTVALWKDNDGSSSGTLYGMGAGHFSPHQIHSFTSDYMYPRSEDIYLNSL